MQGQPWYLGREGSCTHPRHSRRGADKAAGAWLQELEEEAETAKQAWLKKQRSMRDKASGNKSKEVQALNKQLQAALQVLDVERYHVAACEEAAMSAEKGHGRCAPWLWLSSCSVLKDLPGCIFRDRLLQQAQSNGQDMWPKHCEMELPGGIQVPGLQSKQPKWHACDEAFQQLCCRRLMLCFER